MPLLRSPAVASPGSNERPASGSPFKDAGAVAGLPGLLVFLDPGIERSVSAKTLRHYETAFSVSLHSSRNTSCKINSLEEIDHRVFIYKNHETLTRSQLNYLVSMMISPEAVLGDAVDDK